LSEVYQPTFAYPDDTVDRDYGLSEEDDYKRNILPYKNLGYKIIPKGDHRFGYYILTGWRVLYTGSNRARYQ
jgi:hypothetical protein